MFLKAVSALGTIYIIIFAIWLLVLLIKMISKRTERELTPKWEIRRTIWPYEDGWGTYCPQTHTVLDTGLDKEEAKRRCADLNEAEARSER